MTIEQALKIKQNWTAEQARNDLERLLLTGERPANKVIALACKALEKQIPKKPGVDNDNGIYETEHCPNCNRQLFPNEHHCRCGQALDWSDRK